MHADFGTLANTARRIPLVDVTEMNGCIELIPSYSKHKQLVLRQHSTVQPYREVVPTMTDPIKVPV